VLYDAGRAIGAVLMRVRLAGRRASADDARPCRCGRNQRAGRVVFLSALVGAYALPALADGPTVNAREVAASGPSNAQVWEPALAAGGDWVLSVFHSPGNGVGYALYNINSPGWTQNGVIPNGLYTANPPEDPSVAYDGQRGQFMVAARGASLEKGLSVWHVLVAHFDPQAPPATVWQSVDDATPGVAALDKPWLVAGDPAGQEFYLVYQSTFGGPYEYLRSVNGGDTWQGGVICLNGDPNQPVSGGFCAQPAVYTTGPLYVVYVVPVAGVPRLRFLVGQDQLDGTVVFSQICGYTQVDGPGDQFDPVPAAPLTVPLNYIQFSNRLPGHYWAKSVPQLSPDPGNPGRMFLAYHDAVAPGSTDVDVYLRVLTGSGVNWNAGARIRVNNDGAVPEHDQFMPCMTVDESSRIHIIFYDDRNYIQDDSALLPKYDVFYAWSTDGGAVWGNLELPSSPPEPALDWTLGSTAHLDPHEYNGIVWCNSMVWTTFAGTRAAETGNKAMVWSTRIGW
jgi:hypothetical protein